MSYISAMQKGDDVVVWERDPEGERVEQIYSAPFYFYVDDEDGEHTTIYGTKVRRIDCATGAQYRSAKARAEEKATRMWESDIPPEMRILSKHYYQATAPKLHVTFYDIEVNYDPEKGFAGVSDPYAPINSVALFHEWEKRYVVICVPPQADWTPERLREECNKIEPIPSEYEVEFLICESEPELLAEFLREIEDSDVICGWNCIPITQSLWTDKCILPAGQVGSINELYGSKRIATSPISNKTKCKLKTALGHIVFCSPEHKFFVKTHPKEQYTNLVNLKEQELTYEEIERMLATHSVFLQSVLRNNTNKDVPDLTLDQLYLAGLIYTDGTLSNPKDINSGFRVFQVDLNFLENLPLIDTSVVGPHKNCYSRGIKSSLIPYNLRSMIYEGNLKKLSLAKLSTLSYEQFCAFLAGMLDGDGTVAAGKIEWCNYNSDIDTVVELLLWNGALASRNIKGKTPRLRILSNIVERLPLRKHTRWNKLTPYGKRTQLSKRKSSKIKFIRDNNTVWTRIVDAGNTGEIVQMVDFTTTTKRIVTAGVVAHNSDLFDTPYVGKRLIANFGEKFLSKLDFRGAKPRWRDIQDKYKTKVIGQTLDLQGRQSLDYMRLFKKYEQNAQQTYRLAAVQEAVGLDMPKLQYPGTLHDLYYKNFPFFVRYNIRDTEILGGFERKLGYVELANQMVHISCGLFSHVLGTLKLAEYATINHCHHNLKQIVPNFVKIPDEQDRQIEGALVLEPDIGMHEWIGSIDIMSLYPSDIRALNISPEMLRGQFEEKIEAAEAIEKSTSMPLKLVLENGDAIEKTAAEFREWLWKQKWAVSGYGTVFDQSKKGIIPTILGDWYATRKKYQKTMKDLEKAGEKEKAGYFDRLQYVYKIKLNSFYGALTNLYFRFFDIRMGESVTATGRRILRHQCSKVNEVLDGTYQLKGGAVIYGDTDSAYFRTFANNKAEAIAVANAVADKVNKSYKAFMQDTFLCQPGFDDIIACDRELVSDRGIFVEKKRYILHLVDKGNKSVDTLKVMGLDTKKTILPKYVSEHLNKFIERLLKGEDWSSIAASVVEYKDILISAEDITLLGLPKGINDIDYFYDAAMFRTYAKRNARTGRVHVSGHVAASLHYNRCLEEFSDKVSLPIKDGMKIKVFYLIGDFETLKLINGEEVDLKSIALPADLEVVPQWFLEKFRVDIDAHIERLVDNPLENILKAIGKEAPTKQSLLVDSLLTF